MTDVIETFDPEQFPGLRVEIVYDDAPVNPHDEWQSCTIVSFTDELVGDVSEFIEGGWDTVGWCEKHYDVAAAIPVLYSNYGCNGAALTPNVDVCVSNVVAFYDPAAMQAVAGDDIECAKQALRDEIEEYSAYIEGNCFGFVIRDESGEMVDSCWGFYSMEHVRQSATEAAEVEMEAMQTERAEAAEMAARDIMTIEQP